MSITTLVMFFGLLHCVIMCHSKESSTTSPVMKTKAVTSTPKNLTEVNTTISTPSTCTNKSSFYSSTQPSSRTTSQQPTTQSNTIESTTISMSSTSSHITNPTPSASKNLTTADWLTQSSTQILITAECPIWVYIVVAVSTVAVVLVSELVGVFLFISCKNYRQSKKICKEEDSVKIYSSESEQPEVCEKENEFSQIYDVVAEDSEGIQGKRFDNDKRSDPFPLVPDDYSSNDVRVKNVTQSRVSTKEPEYGLTANVLYQSA